MSEPIASPPWYNPVNKWGFSNDPAQLEAVRAIVAAAIADGWDIQPGHPSESVERSAKLTREGFVMSALMRDNSNKYGHWKYEASVYVWGPDELCLPPPSRYEADTFAWMHRMLRVCPECGAEDVDTVRYAFAGRCCTACLPAMRAEHEQPGWYN